jgi:hypothetical protein
MVPRIYTEETRAEGEKFQRGLSRSSVILPVSRSFPAFRNVSLGRLAQPSARSHQKCSGPLVSGSTAAPAVIIGALADEAVSAYAPREAHGATREGARGPRGKNAASAGCQ